MPVYGTVYRCRPKPGQVHIIEALAERWRRERAPAVEGFIAQYLVRSETRPGELLGLVLFDSKASYQQNAEDPEQHRWYQQFRAALEADIEWNDGEVVALAAATVPL
jgi:hypothetical protein